MNAKTKKTRKPREKTQLDAKSLRHIAKMVRNYADKYEAAAEIIEKSARGFMLAGGIDSLENRALKELRGNSSEVLKAAELLMDSETLLKIAEAADSYVANKPMPTPVADDASAKKQLKKTAGKKVD